MNYSLDNGVTTLNNTIEYPVKSAILRGQTLVNSFMCKTSEDFYTYRNVTVSNGVFTLTGNNSWNTMMYPKTQALNIKPSTKYTLILYVEENNTVNSSTELIEIGEVSSQGSSMFNSTRRPTSLSIGANKFLMETKADFSASDFGFVLRFYSSVTGTLKFKISLVEGDYTNIDIPYFEGMTSVKMPVLTTYGKNLFDVSRHGSLTPQPTGDIQLNSAEWGKYDVKYLLKPNTQYTLTILGDGTKCWIAISVDGSSQSSNVETSYTKTFSTNSNGEVTIGIYANSDKYVGYSRKSISIEEGTVSTPYEPYKSNILSCNEEVILRGIGEVRDELNLSTGELTQRIGEVVLDGSEDWEFFAQNGWQRYLLTIEDMVNIYDYKKPNRTHCDKLVYDVFDTKNSGSYLRVHNQIAIYNNEIIHNINQFKQWLSQNPITIQYQLATESIKTVDLSTVDQDGKETELSTFDDITHVTVSSEELVPTGEINVGTKNATDVIDAGIMSLRMDDISNSQSTLEESANAQSDDIDVTMLGVTDIYEQLL